MQLVSLDDYWRRSEALNVTERLRTADPNSEQQRKKSELLNLLESLMDDVESGRYFGEFGITFTTQSGKIGHYEEVRKRTFK